MHIQYSKHPLSLLLCLIWSIIGLFVIFFHIGGIIQIILGIPLILFIPGYILIYALFPNKDIDAFERIILSIACSIAIITLLGLLLNYTVWGIGFESILFSLELFIIVIGIIALLRWRLTSVDNRYNFTINFSFLKTQNKLSKTLTIILIICVITVFCLLFYAILTPKIGERFTEFYLLGPNRMADDYPINISLGENTSVIVGIVNHQYRTINYTIEVWLSNQTTEYNTTSQQNETIFHNLWFMDNIMVSLDHQPIDLEEKWAPQWEYEYTFHIGRKGTYKLMFLLYTTQRITYFKNYDYKILAPQKIGFENMTAYRSNHLWITVT